MNNAPIKYLASWEHLHLVGSILSGLPNNIFSQNSWSLILFDEIYCDEVALNMEIAAAEVMGWTNSKQFVVAKKEGILRTVRITDLAGLEIRALEKKLGISNLPTFFSQLSDDDLFHLRHHIINSAFKNARIVTLDYYSPENLDLPKIFVPTPEANLPVCSVSITKDLRALPPDVRLAFEKTQEHEKKRAAEVNRGFIRQDAFFNYLEPLRSEYHCVDRHLGADVGENWKKLFRTREKFQKKGGWHLVNNYFSLYLEDPVVFASESSAMKAQIEKTLAEALSVSGDDFRIAGRNVFREASVFVPGRGLARKADAIKSMTEDIVSLLKDASAATRRNINGLIRKR